MGARGSVHCCFLSAGGAPGKCACSPSDGGVAGGRACFSPGRGVAGARASRPSAAELLQPVLSGALRRDLEEEPSESVSLSPRKLLRNAFAVLGSFPLKCLFPLLPSWSRPKWWSVYSHRAFKELYRAPSSTPADTAGVCSTWWPLRYHVTTSLCGLLVGSSSRGGTRVLPFYLVGDVVVGV